MIYNGKIACQEDAMNHEGLKGKDLTMKVNATIRITPKVINMY